MAYHGVTVEDSLDALEQLFKADVDPARVAAIIIEPVLGEGGFYAAPAELLRKLRALCDQHGIVLIVDEIQSGFGRTGRMFAIEHAGVEPDLITVAKSVAGGVPLSAVIGKADIMDCAGAGRPGRHLCRLAARLRGGARGARGDPRGEAAGARAADRPLHEFAAARAAGALSRRSARCAASAPWWRSSW